MSSPPRLYSLQEAADLLSPSGKLTAKSLRTEARRGRLQLVRIAGKHFVTAESLAAMVTSASPPSRPPGHAPGNHPAFTSAEPEKTALPSGSSSTARLRAARAAANVILNAPNGHLPTTLPRNTSLRARLPRARFS